MDIGCVKEEEVNYIVLNQIFVVDVIHFGWGRNLVDGNTREVTLYVDPVTEVIMGNKPPCEVNAPILKEGGFVKPWIQFGRSENDFLMPFQVLLFRGMFLIKYDLSGQN